MELAAAGCGSSGRWRWFCRKIEEVGKWYGGDGWSGDGGGRNGRCGARRESEEMIVQRRIRLPRSR